MVVKLNVRNLAIIVYLDTARFFFVFFWYNMLNIVHKVLMHDKDIIATALLPIGQLSKDAQEALTKIIRYNKEHHTRKCSRFFYMFNV